MSRPFVQRRYHLRPVVLSVECFGLTMVDHQGKEGLVIVKTKLSLIIAHHPDNVTTPNCVNVVESLAAYLVKANY